jgi:outer membrane protein insertion porin family
VVTELRGGDRNVTYYIEEGKKVALEEVIITGCKAISSKEIKAAIKNQEEGFFSFMGRGGTLRTEELKDDVETIRNLYYNKGYIQVQVDDPVIEPKSYTFRECFFWGPPKTFLRKSELVVRFNIKEGDQFKVGSIALKGNTLLSDEELLKEIKLKKGDIFSRDMLRQDVGSIMDRYDSIARPFANVIPQFNIDESKKTVAINIDIQEGGEVRIGRIDITGNSKTRDKVIRREMRLDEGDLYSKKSIKRSYERLTNLNFFETVDIAQERRLQESVLDLNVKVKEKLTGTLSVGGGYSSVDKLVGIAEITQGNFGGRGQLLKFKTQWGGTRKLFMLTFMEPYLFDKPVWGRVDLYNQVQDYDGYSLRTNGFAFSIGKSFGEYVSTSLRYSLDASLMTNLTTTNTSFAVQRQIETYGRGMNTSALTWSLARDSRDFYLDPKTGSKNSIFVEYAGGPLGGDPNFVKSVGESAWFFPLFWDTVFMTRGRVGYVESLITKPIPMGERFFVGGGGTVRGFRYGTAGPVDRDDNRVGGNKELVFNFEFTFPIVPAARLKGVVFLDWGRAFDDNLVANDSPTGKPKEPTQISLKELRSSWGWGFWWLSPIGPLKFEWGYILHKRPTDEKSEFEFSIGALF